jgi:hypothetical protein
MPSEKESTMNRNISATCFLIMFITTSAMALDENSCVSQSAQLKPSERDAFIKSCLKQLSSPSNVEKAEQQRLKALCEQNAKNYHLEGDEQTNYVTSCMSHNEAEVVQSAPGSPSKPITGSFNFGVGLAYADVPEGGALSWDILAGYEWITTDSWEIGAQAHVLASSISDTSLTSLALYATARPKNWWLQWLQLKAGLVSADYSKTFQVENFQTFTIQNQTINWGGTGEAVGVGLVIPGPNFQFHILDIERYFVVGHSFNVYTISVMVLAAL